MFYGHLKPFWCYRTGFYYHILWYYTSLCVLSKTTLINLPILRQCVFFFTTISLYDQQINMLYYKMQPMIKICSIQLENHILENIISFDNKTCLNCACGIYPPMTRVILHTYIRAHCTPLKGCLPFHYVLSLFWLISSTINLFYFRAVKMFTLVSYNLSTSSL